MGQYGNIQHYISSQNLLQYKRTNDEYMILHIMFIMLYQLSSVNQRSQKCLYLPWCLFCILSTWKRKKIVQRITLIK